MSISIEAFSFKFLSLFSLCVSHDIFPSSFDCWIFSFFYAIILSFLTFPSTFQGIKLPKHFHVTSLLCYFDSIKEAFYLNLIWFCFDSWIVSFEITFIAFWYQIRLTCFHSTRSSLSWKYSWCLLLGSLQGFLWSLCLSSTHLSATCICLPVRLCVSLVSPNSQCSVLLVFLCVCSLAQCLPFSVWTRVSFCFRYFMCFCFPWERTRVWGCDRERKTEVLFKMDIFGFPALWTFSVLLWRSLVGMTLSCLHWWKTSFWILWPPCLSCAYYSILARVLRPLARNASAHSGTLSRLSVGVPRGQCTN